jgi:hypothetical protein
MGGKRGMLERHLAQIEAVEKEVGIEVRGKATSYSHVSHAVWVNMWSFTLYGVPTYSLQVCRSSTEET